MGGSALIKTMAVLYTDLQTPIYALVSASGVITNSDPAPITLSPVSVSGTAVVLGVYAQTLGTSAARTFTPAATTAVFAGAMETRILLNADTTCVIDMGDEGSANTLLGVFFSASED